MCDQPSLQVSYPPVEAGSLFLRPGLPQLRLGSSDELVQPGKTIKPVDDTIGLQITADVGRPWSLLGPFRVTRGHWTVVLERSAPPRSGR
jgi:hypothetical protein